MKKLLTSLMMMSILSTSTTSIVVACKKNKDPKNTVVSTFGANPQNWVTAKTFNAEDYYVLANTNATPLATDEYDRVYGDLFKLTNTNYSKDDPYIGKHNGNYKEWTYNLRDNATWSDYKGNVLGIITIEDFINTAKYVLNPSNTSDLINQWNEHIYGASDLYKEASVKGADFDELFNKYYTGKNGVKKLGIQKIGANQIQFTLNKSETYFESILCFGAFSPIHSAVLEDPGINNDYKKGYYSGPFLPTSFAKDSSLILDKNKNYYFAEKTNVNRVRKVFVNGSASKSRELFEANTINEFAVNSNDKAGWDKYVGDPNNPNKTNGMIKYTSSPGDITTWVMFYNFLNQDYISGDAESKNRAKIASRALQYKEIRKLIESGINRTDWLTYYSKIYDNNSEMSKNLRNTFVPYDLVNTSVEKQYGDYVVDALNEMKFQKVNNKVVEKSDLVDETDFLRLANTGSVASNYLNDTSFNRNMSKIIDGAKKAVENDKTLSELIKSNKKILLVSAEDPTSSASVGAYKSEMIQKFNKIENNFIEIKEVKAADWNGYVDMLQNGKSDLVFSGWSPGYRDPMGYLTTLKLDGDYDMYLRQNQLFNFKSFDTLQGINATEAYNSLKNVNKQKFEDVIVENNEGISPLFESRYNYTKNILKIDAGESIDSSNTNNNQTLDQRYSDFAKMEAKTLYDEYFVMPLMRGSLKMSFSISHIEPFKRSRSPFGSSSSSYFNSNFTKDLLTYEEIENLRKKYEERRSEVESDLTSNRDIIIWSQ